jgi:hypothetical protein
MGPGSPTVATEWTIEAQSGATCKVRVVHSWFADTEDWDQHFAGVEQGWAAFFRILTLYLAHFPGQKSQAFQLLQMTPLTSNEAWEALVRPLGIGNSQPGAHVRSADPALPFSGIVERVGPPEFPELMLRLDTPGAGVAHVFVMKMGGSTCVSIRAFLYGDQAPDAATRFERAWSAWASAHVPSSTPEGAAAQETR